MSRGYGAIDQQGPGHDPDATWPNWEEWTEVFQVPVASDPAYRLRFTGERRDYMDIRTDARGRLTAFRVNVDLAPLLRQAFLNLQAERQLCYVKTIQSMFNVGPRRLDRGNADGPSAHAYGLAFDLNPGENPPGNTHVFGSKVVNAMTSAGLYWGYWFSTPDPHHFGLGW